MAESEDMLVRLQALLGQDGKQAVWEAPAGFEGLNPLPVPDLYPLSDSDDDEFIGRTCQIAEKLDDDVAANTETDEIPGEAVEWEEYQLELGQLAKEQTESFCPWQTIKKYPHTYIGKANREKVEKKFFAHGKCESRTWDFFYLHRVDEPNPNPILLVPSRQFEHFLGVINKKLNTALTLPHIGPNGGFAVTFKNDGTPQPRYLGRSTSREMADELKFAVPPKSFLPDGEIPSTVAPTDRSLAAFKAKVDLINQAQKGKKLASKERAKQERFAKQQSWSHALKRVQRYLGLRDRSQLIGWDEIGHASCAHYDPDMPIIYEPESNVVFVCVDVEAWERNKNIITEIGIATLDTDDIKSIAPGPKGENWMKLIRARHFRIKEHKHHENVDFVHGCADRFGFGESEFISIKDAPAVIGSCFRPPYSKPGGSTESLKRNIVLVGHDVDADITFLREMGYDVLNLNLKEKQDTASMYRYLRREPHPRNLGHILADLDILGWNLHNAGNDAVYTLQAMLGISIAHIVERKAKEDAAAKEAALQEKIDEAIKEAIEKTKEMNEGWSSGGENSDGGPAVIPESPGRKRPGYGSNRQGGNQSRENDGSFSWENSTSQRGNGYSKGTSSPQSSQSRGKPSGRGGGNANSPWRGGRSPGTQRAAKKEEDLIGFW